MIPQEDECLVEAILKPIKILAKVDKIWVVDPDSNDVHLWWDLWVVRKNHYLNWNGTEEN